jgi:hypothetical protein
VGFISRWRKMTWVFLIVNALFVLWVSVGVGDRPSKDCANDPDVKAGIISQDLCESASDVGTSIGVALIVLLWFFVFVAVSLIWFMTRPRGRQCPACGETVKKGRTSCQKCSHDFAAAATAPAAPAVSS